LLYFRIKLIVVNADKEPFMISKIVDANALAIVMTEIALHASIGLTILHVHADA